MLPTQLVAAEVSGFVERAELRAKDGKQNGRIVLRVTALERAGEPRPERVRVTAAGYAARGRQPCHGPRDAGPAAGAGLSRRL